MNYEALHSRRVFLQGVGSFTAAAAAQGQTPLASSPATHKFAYVGTALDELVVFAINGAKRQQIQVMPSKAPACLVLHPNAQSLYVVNDISEYEGLPQGTVEAYAIDEHSHRLTLLSKRCLSLSATNPRHAAVSPDGKHLIVASYGGGIYNLFNIQQDGGLSHVSGIVKEIGCGLHPQHQASAHPHSLIFDLPGNHVISSDFGCDRLNVFSIEDGNFLRKSTTQLQEGFGPGRLTLDASGSVLSVWKELGRSISHHLYDSLRGEIESTPSGHSAYFDARETRSIVLT